ncbi:hypothetical protein [Rhodanobacter sp. C01]|uniref:hypothetical protein n=1 Tax=Rhodanobacter sp. C01 TaxID=1945856 RepID=UPI000984D5D4|nr:hypothetical protein [Rhodanobacter sp. C01]OOG49846.1 hypothetical protein B0E50_04470 [Rhodanobacter sp. C01]
MRPQTRHVARHSHLPAIALLWLLGGSALLLTTLVPLHTALLGWTPTFWLLGAPLVVLLVLEPTLPRQLLALYRVRRHTLHGAAWH